MPAPETPTQSETRVCSQCELPKPLDAFKAGRAFCVECGRAMERMYYAKRMSDPVKKARAREQDRVSKRRRHDKEYYRARYGIKQRAQRTIRNRILRGSLTRQPCVICGATPADAHHEDYDKPTSIVWLCRAHHKAVHDGVLRVTPEQICHV